MMEKPVLYGIIGILAGVIIGIFVARYAINNKNYGMMNMMGMGEGMMQIMRGDKSSLTEENGMHRPSQGMNMGDMSSILTTLKGDEFDETFLELMIQHHQGAIDMARLAPTNSSRKEIRDFAEDINIAQTKEIEMMKGWLENWW